MIGALIILASLIVVGTVLYVHHRLTHRNTPEPPVVVREECCGMHTTCERESLLATVSKAVEYFDDEELDRFAGREATAYTPEEVEEFRDVLLTLRPEDVAPWGRSIQLRGITLPPEVRDELVLMISEQRQQ